MDTILLKLFVVFPIQFFASMSKIADTIEKKRLQDELIERLCVTLSGYLDQAQINDCVRAYEFSADAHSGQFRKSGESYICHPLSVAITLAEMRMDASGIMAAILHDLGKSKIDYEIINKNGKLTDEEFAQMKHHPALGHEIALKLNITDERVLTGIRHHHEKTVGGNPGVVHENIDAAEFAVCGRHAVTNLR